jgi:hypothetical protein
MPCALTIARTAAATRSGSRAISASVVESAAKVYCPAPGGPSPLRTSTTIFPTPRLTAVSLPSAFAQAALERLGGEDAERGARVERARYRRDGDAVPRGIDADLAEHLEKHAVRPGRGADAEPLDRRDVAAARWEIGAQDQEPRCSLRERDGQLRALPAREREQHRVRAAGHEVHLTLPERVHCVQRRQELDVGIEPFVAIEAELLGGEGREIRVRHQVGRRDPHEAPSATT